MFMLFTHITMHVYVPEELAEALKKLPMAQIVDLTGEEDSHLMSSEKKLELPEGTRMVKALRAAVERGLRAVFQGFSRFSGLFLPISSMF